MGGYVWDTAADSWWWTPGFYRIHGCRPGEGEASTEHLLRQVQEQDRLRVEEWLRHVAKVEGRFAFDYRIGVDGSERTIASEGVSEIGRARGMIVTGHVASPIQGPPHTEVDRLRSEVHNAWAAHESLGSIEQAKGAIMLACNCDDSSAFTVLSRTSQQTNIKVREVADQILAVVTDQAEDSPRPEVRRTILRELLRAKGEGGRSD